MNKKPCALKVLALIFIFYILFFSFPSAFAPGSGAHAGLGSGAHAGLGGGAPAGGGTSTTVTPSTTATPPTTTVSPSSGGDCYTSTAPRKTTGARRTSRTTYGGACAYIPNFSFDISLSCEQVSGKQAVSAKATVSNIKDSRALNSAKMWLWEGTKSVNTKYVAEQAGEIDGFSYSKIKSFVEFRGDNSQRRLVWISYYNADESSAKRYLIDGGNLEDTPGDYTHDGPLYYVLDGGKKQISNTSLKTTLDADYLATRNSEKTEEDIACVCVSGDNYDAVKQGTVFFGGTVKDNSFGSTASFNEWKVFDVKPAANPSDIFLSEGEHCLCARLLSSKSSAVKKNIASAICTVGKAESVDSPPARCVDCTPDDKGNVPAECTEEDKKPDMTGDETGTEACKPDGSGLVPATCADPDLFGTGICVNVSPVSLAREILLSDPYTSSVTIPLPFAVIDVGSYQEVSDKTPDEYAELIKEKNSDLAKFVDFKVEENPETNYSLELTISLKEDVDWSLISSAVKKFEGELLIEYGAFGGDLYVEENEEGILSPRESIPIKIYNEKGVLVVWKDSAISGKVIALAGKSDGWDSLVVNHSEERGSEARSIELYSALAEKWDESPFSYVALVYSPEEQAEKFPFSRSNNSSLDVFLSQASNGEIGIAVSRLPVSSEDELERLFTDHNQKRKNKDLLFTVGVTNKFSTKYEFYNSISKKVSEKDWSDAEEISGYEEKQVLSKKFDEIVANSELEAVKGIKSLVEEGKSPAGMDYVLVRAGTYSGDSNNYLTYYSVEDYSNASFEQSERYLLSGEKITKQLADFEGLIKRDAVSTAQYSKNEKFKNMFNISLLYPDSTGVMADFASQGIKLSDGDYYTKDDIPDNNVDEDIEAISLEFKFGLPARPIIVLDACPQDNALPQAFVERGASAVIAYYNSDEFVPREDNFLDVDEVSVGYSVIEYNRNAGDSEDKLVIYGFPDVLWEGGRDTGYVSESGSETSSGDMSSKADEPEKAPEDYETQFDLVDAGPGYVTLGSAELDNKKDWVEASGSVSLPKTGEDPGKITPDLFAAYLLDEAGTRQPVDAKIVVEKDEGNENEFKFTLSVPSFSGLSESISAALKRLRAGDKAATPELVVEVETEQGTLSAKRVIVANTQEVFKGIKSLTNNFSEILAGIVFKPEAEQFLNPDELIQQVGTSYQVLKNPKAGDKFNAFETVIKGRKITAMVQSVTGNGTITLALQLGNDQKLAVLAPSNNRTRVDFGMQGNNAVRASPKCYGGVSFRLEGNDLKAIYIKPLTSWTKKCATFEAMQE